MKMSLEDLAGMLFPLFFAVIAGFAVAVSIFVDGMCRKSLFMLAAWLASTGILWSVPFIFQRFRRGKKVHMDERGLMIFKNALLAAHTASWFYFLIACFIAWWLVGPTGSVSVNVLPLLFVGWAVVFQFVLVLGSAFQDRLGTHHGQ
jgi:hypothetical protein